MPEILRDFDQLPNIDQRVAAQLLQITYQRVNQHVDDGTIRRLGTTHHFYFKIEDLFRGYINYLKKNKPTASADRVRLAKAKEIELRSAVRSGKLIDVEEAEARLVQFAGMIRAKHVALSSRVTRDLTLRKAIDKEINAIDAAAADWLEALATALEEGREGDAAAADDDAGRLGGDEQGLSDDGTDTGST